MTEPIENLYFNWLYSNVSDLTVHEPALAYFKLLGELHRTEFVWLLSGDDNRAEDGLALRSEFLHKSFIKHDTVITSEGCSVLEMLVAFSRRAAFEGDDTPRDWFWVMLDNLELSDLNDPSNPNPDYIQGVLETFVWRTYDYNGNGGLFPLHHTQHDQRKVEIWYQFNEYLAERDWG